MTFFGEWQLIETAPRDGSEILLFRADAGVLLGRWIAPVDFLSDRELIEAELDQAGAEEPDWFIADFCQGCRLTDGAPTHWMPFPPFPKETP